MLRLDELRLARGDFRLSADLAVAAGARVAIMGPSGSGKSTLLAAIAGFLEPAGGRILWDGAPMDGPPQSRPVAMLFQEENLFPHLSLARNAALALRPNGRPTARERARVAEALARVGLSGLGERRPGAVSGGQRSRAALARALLQRRPLLLLDEPFAALGPALRADMLGLVGEVAGETGAAVLMVTHDPADARALAGETIVVEGGRAHPPVPTGPLLDDPPPALAAYLGPA